MPAVAAAEVAEVAAVAVAAEFAADFSDDVAGAIRRVVHQPMPYRVLEDSDNYDRCATSLDDVDHVFLGL